MTIPILHQGRQIGTLTEEDGVLRGDMEDMRRVVRLYVFGERVFYAGIPEPENGRLRLEKCLTAADRRLFPQNPVYAGERDEKPPAEKKAPGQHVLWQGGRPHYF